MNKIIYYLNSAIHKVFNPRLTCSLCGREIFGSGFFCAECEKTLPYNNSFICDHCGRKTAFPSEYCDSCKDFNLSFDGARSAFDYRVPVDKLITGLKYGNKKYLAEMFAEKLTD